MQNVGGANEHTQANSNGQPPLLVILVKPARWENASAATTQHTGLRPQQAVPDSIESGHDVCHKPPQLISKSCQCASGCWHMLQQGMLEQLEPPLSIIQSALQMQLYQLAGQQGSSS